MVAHMFEDGTSLSVCEATHDADEVLFFILEYTSGRELESFIACDLALTCLLMISEKILSWYSETTSRALVTLGIRDEEVEVVECFRQ